MQTPRISRRSILQGTAATTTVWAAGRRLASAQTPQAPRVLRIRIEKDISALDPAHAGTRSEHAVVWALSNRLTMFKPTGDKWEWQPDLARELKQESDTRVRFTLRPGVQWTNGFGEVTAEDVKYSFERYLDPNFKSGNAVDWKLLERVEVVDKHTGVIVLKAPFPALWISSLPRTSGAIVCKKAVEGVGGSYKNNPPATSGPYVLKEWRPKEVVILARNPLWNGRRPDFDEIHFRPIDDQKTAELAFEAGEIDFTEVSVSSLPKYLKSAPAGARVAVRPLVGIEWVGMNVEHPVLKDARVRKAIQNAIDPAAFIDAAYFGQAKPAMGLIPAGVMGHRERKLVAGRDLATARRLLAEAGVASGFKTTLAVLNNTDSVTGAQVIQANLAEVGIDVQITPYESGTFWNLGVEGKGNDWKTLQLYLQKWGLPPDPGGMTQWWTTEQIGKWNWERWSDPEFDSLHRQALSEMDPKKREQLYKQMQDRMEASGAFVWLTNGVQALMYRNWIEPGTTPDGRLLLVSEFRRAG
jgi:peptide/nickel transport system substrate-binding protein